MNEESSKTKNPIEQKPEHQLKTSDGREIPEIGIKTLEKGSSEAIKGKQGVFVKVAIAEEKRREEEKIRLEKIARKKIVYISVGGFLFLVSLFIILFILQPQKNKSVQVEQKYLLKFGTIYSQVDITMLPKREIIRKIRDEIDKPLTEGIVKTLSLTENTPVGEKRILVSRFFEQLDMNPPENLTRDILTGEFLFNVYGGERAAPFIVAKTKSGTNALKTMAEWESSLASDMSEIFGITSSAEINKNIFSKEFENVFVKNVLVRLIKNDAGQTLFLYTVLNDETLIITDSVDVLPKIIEWLYAPSIRN